VASRIVSSLLLDYPEYQSLVEDFVVSLPHQLQVLQAAIDSGDLESVAEGAHALKGTCGTMGFHGFTPLAERLEQHARGERVDLARNDFRELSELASRVVVGP
jgi:HPt (histidine-containing phosphotransfer) domain-containing protein